MRSTATSSSSRWTSSPGHRGLERPLGTKSKAGGARPRDLPRKANGAFARAQVTKFARASREEYEAALAELVEIPSVSVEAARKGDVRRAAERAAAHIRSRGGEAEILETGGHPLVAGSFPGDPALPTVTIYNHLDVQPADGPEWRTDPFRFTRRGDRYFARGTTDDKGPALAALWGASYAVQHGARVNVRFLWELEEEIGSPHFERAIRR